MSENGDPAGATQRPRATQRPSAASRPTQQPGSPAPPWSRGVRLSRPAMFRIGGTAVFLVLVLVAQRPCANAVANLVTHFDQPATGSSRPPPALPDAGAIDLRNAQHLRPEMSDAETKAAIDRARGTPASATGSSSP